MKCKNKLACIVLTGIVAISSITPALAENREFISYNNDTVEDIIYNDATENGEDTELTPMVASTYREYGTKLGQYGKKLYADMVDSFSDISTEVAVYDYNSSERPTISEFNGSKELAKQALLLDYPEQFWNVSYIISATQTTAGKVSQVTVTAIRYNNESVATLRSMSETMDNIASSAISAMKRDVTIKTDRDIFLWIHNYLIDHVEYDKSGDNRETSPNSYNAYGALVDNKAVCQGYSAAFQLLCHKAKVISVIVNGTKNGAPHSWNYAQIGNKKYFLDVTNDDAANRYFYFLKAMPNAYTAFEDGTSNRFTPENTNAFMYGDIDCDGKISANDSALLQSDILCGNIDNYGKSDFIVADVNGNGVLTAEDCSYILQKALDTSFKFPVEQ